MRFKDIEEKNNQINFIKEAFTGEFTIGFELEGISCWNLDGDFHLPSYDAYSEINQPKGAAKALKDYLDKTFDLEGSSGNSKIEHDGSLNTNGFSHRDFDSLWTFEYATNKIPFNAKNLEKIYDGLTQLGDDGIYTNNSCGFHIHMSFPDMNKEDITWIICCIACDTKLLDELLYLNTFDGKIELFNEQYAKTNFLEEIREAILINENYKEIGNLLSNEKYNVLHIDDDHKTIEWRGPRGFLNNDDSSIIKSFILKWFKFISKIAKISQSTSYKIESDEGEVTLNKYDLLKEINLKHLIFISDKEEKNRKKLIKIINNILDAPVKIFSLSPKSIEHIYKAEPYQFSKALRELFKNDMFSEDWVYSKPNFIEKVYNIFLQEGYSDKSLTTFEFCYQLYEYYKENNENFIQSMPINIKKDLIDGISKLILTDTIFHHNEINFIKEINEEYDLFNTSNIKNILKKLYSNKDIKNFEKIFQINNNNLPGYIWNILMDNRYIWNLHYLKEIPEKYQLRLVQKNPYNLQYINNPCEKAIQLAEKTVPNIKDYI